MARVSRNVDCSSAIVLLDSSAAAADVPGPGGVLAEDPGAGESDGEVGPRRDTSTGENEPESAPGDADAASPASTASRNEMSEVRRCLESGWLPPACAGEAAEAGDSVVAAVCLPASGGARLGLGALTAKQVWRVTAAVDAHQDVVARTQVEAVQGSREVVAVMAVEVASDARAERLAGLVRALAAAVES